jgi:hypothetical protein
MALKNSLYDKMRRLFQNFNLEFLSKARHLYVWKDSPNNPILSATEPKDWVADPTVVTPEQSPDGYWHMFCCGGLGVKHYRSSDGLNWGFLEVLGSGYSPFIFVEDGTYYLFYQESSKNETYIVYRESRDLKNWNDPSIILKGDLSWEMGLKGEPYVRNPCILKLHDKYLLYYSASYILLPDTGYDEPLFIGLAVSTDGITGPYVKNPEPILKPDFLDPWRNFGAGAMKVYYDDGLNLLLGFENGIYIGPDGHTHSALHLLTSVDGVNWIDSPYNPILKPEGCGWKSAFVYQCDVKRVEDNLYLYYNARDGWRNATERIGLALCKIK